MIDILSFSITEIIFLKGPQRCFFIFCKGILRIPWFSLIMEQLLFVQPIV